MWPSLSVLIPSYNQGQYIERTILSILGQNYQGELQIIVADGGSQDSTVEVLKKHPHITWWSRPDKGYTDAVTQALAVATGEIIAIQSSDDFYLRGAFETVMPFLRERPELGLVTGAHVVLQDDHPPYNHPPLLQPLVATELRSPADLLVSLGINQHCTFVRRAAIDKVGGLRASVDQCADFDLWYRILHFSQGLILPRHLAVYQKHSAQRTQNKAQLWLDSFDRVLESCKAEEKYAREFVPSPLIEEEFRKAMELMWYQAAGGAQGEEVAARLARDIVRNPDRWSDDLRRQARVTLERSAKERFFLVRLRNKARLRTRLLQFAGRPLGRSGTPAPEDVPTIDIEWWRGVKG